MSFAAVSLLRIHILRLMNEEKTSVVSVSNFGIDRGLRDESTLTLLSEGDPVVNALELVPGSLETGTSGLVLGMIGIGS